jgi:ketosteroid isomerase-like protein
MMRHVHALLATLLCAVSVAQAGARTEQLIRELEQQQAKAAIARDRAALERLFAPEFKVINPNGVVSSRDTLLALLASDGPPPYRSAAYTTDEVRDYGTVVVSIGMDTVVPNQGPQAGQTVLRRVTQVWQKQKGSWRLVLRHANVITSP